MKEAFVKYYKDTLQFFRNIRKGIQKFTSKVSVPDYTIFSAFAIITGAIVGLGAVFFHETIDFFEHLFFEEGTSNLVFLGAAAVILVPALGMLLQSLMIKAAPETSKQRGISEVIKAVAIRGGFIPLRTTIFHFIAPALSIGSGNTVGPEGPAAQIGGGLASKLGNLLGLSDSRRRIFTAAGAGAAISAVFNTPLAGVFFALEIVLLNDFQSATFSALILASVTASAISRIFLGDNPAFSFGAADPGPYQEYYLFALLGFIAGLLAILYIRYSENIHSLFKNKISKKIPQWLVMTAIGLAVGISGFFYKEIFGIGYKAINNILAGNLPWDVVLVILVLKFLLVPLILHSGGFGGIFAPSLFIGACYGYLFAFVGNSFFGLDLNITTFVLVGMGAVLGGINSIPITSILIIFEMTKNYGFILPLMLAVVMSTIIVQVINKGSVHIKHLEDQGYKISEGRETSILKSMLVRDVMQEDVVLIPDNTPLTRLVTELIESPHGTFYTVDKEGKLSGVITGNELRPIISEYEHIREVLVASDIARPDIITVAEDDDLDNVLKLFGQRNVEEFPVVATYNSDEIIGTIWQQDIITAYNRESLKYNLTDGLAYELKNIEKTRKSHIAKGYSIIEKRAPIWAVGKTLTQLRLRNKYGLEVLMIKREKPAYSAEDNHEDLIIPDSTTKIEANDVLVIFGADEKLSEIKS